MHTAQFVYVLNNNNCNKIECNNVEGGVRKIAKILGRLGYIIKKDCWQSMIAYKA